MKQFIKEKSSNKTIDYLKYLKISKEFIETIEDDELELYKYLALYTWYTKYTLGEEKCFFCSNDISHPKINDDQIFISISDYEVILCFEDDFRNNIKLIYYNMKYLPNITVNLIDKCRVFNENKVLTKD